MGGTSWTLQAAGCTAPAGFQRRRERLVCPGDMGCKDRNGARDGPAGASSWLPENQPFTPSLKKRVSGMSCMKDMRLGPPYATQAQWVLALCCLMRNVTYKLGCLNILSPAGGTILGTRGCFGRRGLNDSLVLSSQLILLQYSFSTFSKAQTKSCPQMLEERT